MKVVHNESSLNGGAAGGPLCRPVPALDDGPTAGNTTGDFPAIRCLQIGT